MEVIYHAYRGDNHNPERLPLDAFMPSEQTPSQETIAKSKPAAAALAIRIKSPYDPYLDMTATVKDPQDKTIGDLKRTVAKAHMSRTGAEQSALCFVWFGCVLQDDFPIQRLSTSPVLYAHGLSPMSVKAPQQAPPPVSGMAMPMLWANPWAYYQPSPAVLYQPSPCMTQPVVRGAIPAGSTPEHSVEETPAEPTTEDKVQKRQQKRENLIQNNRDKSIFTIDLWCCVIPVLTRCFCKSKSIARRVNSAHEWINFLTLLPVILAKRTILCPTCWRLFTFWFLWGSKMQGDFQSVAIVFTGFYWLHLMGLFNYLFSSQIEAFGKWVDSKMSQMRDYVIPKPLSAEADRPDAPSLGNA